MPVALLGRRVTSGRVVSCYSVSVIGWRWRWELGGATNRTGPAVHRGDEAAFSSGQGHVDGLAVDDQRADNAHGETDVTDDVLAASSWHLGSFGVRYIQSSQLGGSYELNRWTNKRVYAVHIVLTLSKHHINIPHWFPLLHCVQFLDRLVAPFGFRILGNW
jgi:hypothetical protein